jgi:hypothetical protein
MDIADQVRSLRTSLDLQPDHMDVRKLFPMFAPAGFFETGGWPGPFVLPAAKGVGITWALDSGEGGHRYLDRTVSAYWEESGVDWQSAALANLRNASVERLYTHRMIRTNGELFAVAMLHTDGWGASRLLLTDALQQLFPEGYRVAIPEMSCGLAISLNLEGTEQGTVQDIVAKCFGDGRRPLSRGVFEPQELVPDWAAV